MISQFLSHFPWPWLTCVGLLLFMGVFVGALFWVYRAEAAGVYSELASAPLREESSGE
jgi:cbb3-type cytochrome oxidase subunit 3